MFSSMTIECCIRGHKVSLRLGTSWRTLVILAMFERELFIHPTRKTEPASRDGFAKFQKIGVFSLRIGS